MSTTLIFAEIISCGIFAAFWIFLLLIGVGLDPKYLNISGLSDSEKTLISISAFAAVYALGVIVDSLADKSLSGVGEKWRKEYNVGPQYSLLSLTLAGRSNAFIEKFLEYIRVRIRIARFFAFNAFFVWLSGVAAGFRLGGREIYWYVVGTIIWVVAGYASYKVLSRLQKVWYQTLGVAWGVWPNDQYQKVAQNRNRLRLRPCTFAVYIPRANLSLGLRKTHPKALTAAFDDKNNP